MNLISTYIHLLYLKIGSFKLSFGPYTSVLIYFIYVVYVIIPILNKTSHNFEQCRTIKETRARKKNIKSGTIFTNVKMRGRNEDILEKKLRRKSKEPCRRNPSRSAPCDVPHVHAQ